MRRVCLAPASFQEGRLGRDLSAAAARPLHPSSCPSPPPDDAAGRSPCGRRWRRGLAGIWKWRTGAGRRQRGRRGSATALAAAPATLGLVAAARSC
ncbi:hypothetical protein BRADI_2g08663v3 [Brachypodium distachyon]|uniref:Uncharacterized protein n=1 Tax=Brachypodium distachyon TaxID=15368 RepID=A0A0Q3MGJ2_BRADI|nr:hypothetical protein BRADI_2g08663v3 [Brachypodium distachyon]